MLQALFKQQAEVKDELLLRTGRGLHRCLLILGSLLREIGLNVSGPTRAPICLVCVVVSTSWRICGGRRHILYVFGHLTIDVKELKHFF